MTLWMGLFSDQLICETLSQYACFNIRIWPMADANDFCCPFNFFLFLFLISPLLFRLGNQHLPLNAILKLEKATFNVLHKKTTFVEAPQAK